MALHENNYWISDITTFDHKKEEELLQQQQEQQEQQHHHHQQQEQKHISIRRLSSTRESLSGSASSLQHNNNTTTTGGSSSNDVSSLLKYKTNEFYIGMIVSTLLSMGYFARPIHVLILLVMIWFEFPNKSISHFLGFIVFIIQLIPVHTYWWKRIGSLLLSPLLDYFEFDEIVENSPIHIRESMKDGKRYIFTMQPHGIVPYCSIVSSLIHSQNDYINYLQQQKNKQKRQRRQQQQQQHQKDDNDNNDDKDSEQLYILPTAIASMVLWTPILRQVMTMFQPCVSATRKGIRQALRGVIVRKKQQQEQQQQDGGGKLKHHNNNNNEHGGVKLFVGETSEVLFCTKEKEVLHLTKRMKSILTFAISSGFDIIPIYLFGNTHSYDILSTSWTIRLSQLVQVPVGYWYGPFYKLPIPYPRKLLLVSGQPLGIQKVKKPGPTLLKHWLNRYCEEVHRLFEQYKERVPEYKHKELIIV